MGAYDDNDRLSEQGTRLPAVGGLGIVSYIESELSPS